MNDQLWAAVDRLTRETRLKMPRDTAGQWITDLHDATEGMCNIAAYRAATSGWATIPSLWDQSTIALFGAEVAVGRGSKPLRERSLADLDLLEIRALVRDTATDHLEQWEQRRPRWTASEFGNTQIRHFASVALTRSGERCTQCRCTHELDFWTYRFAQWARLFENYLRNAEHQAKSVYLRNSPCPTCRTSQVTLDRDGEPVVTPAIIIDFRDGCIRAAQCQACGDSWWRGPDLERLATDLGVGLDNPSAACLQSPA